MTRKWAIDARVFGSFDKRGKKTYGCYLDAVTVHCVLDFFETRKADLVVELFQVQSPNPLERAHS